MPLSVRGRPRYAPRAWRALAGVSGERRARLARARCALVAALAPRGAGRRPPARELHDQPLARAGRSDRVDVHYILDQAEIPTFQRARTARRDGARTQARRGAAVGWTLTVDGRPVAAAARPPGARSLPGRPGRPAHDARRAALCGAASRPGAGRAARPRRTPAAWAGTRSSFVPGRRDRRALERAGHRPHRRAAAYPADLLSSPRDRAASFAVRPGHGTRDGARGARGAGRQTTRARPRRRLRARCSPTRRRRAAC